MRCVLANARRGKTEDPRGIRILVRQPARRQPVEDAVERHPVDRRYAKGLLDLVMGQRCGGCAQQLQDTHARRCGTGAGAADELARQIVAKRAGQVFRRHRIQSSEESEGWI